MPRSRKERGGGEIVNTWSAPTFTLEEVTKTSAGVETDFRLVTNKTSIVLSEGELVDLADLLDEVCEELDLEG